MISPYSAIPLDFRPTPSVHYPHGLFSLAISMHHKRRLANISLCALLLHSAPSALSRFCRGLVRLLDTAPHVSALSRQTHDDKQNPVRLLTAKPSGRKLLLIVPTVLLIDFCPISSSSASSFLSLTGLFGHVLLLLRYDCSSYCCLCCTCSYATQARR